MQFLNDKVTLLFELPQDRCIRSHFLFSATDCGSHPLRRHTHDTAESDTMNFGMTKDLV